MPIIKKDDSIFIEHANVEPLKEECSHFIECIKTRDDPLTDSKSAIEVLKVLKACQTSIEKNGQIVGL